MKWTEGDRVLANRSLDAYWYPSTIQKIEQNRYFVLYDDGDREFLDESKIRPLDIKIGVKVLARKDGEHLYYKGTITKKKLDAYFIKYDHDEEWLPISMLCIPKLD